MFGKKSRMNPLESRRQMLIAESERNRAQLLGDMAELTVEVHVLSKRAKSFGTLASSAAVLVTGLAAFRFNKSMPADAKPSFLQRCLKGAGVASTLWLAFHSRARNQKEK